MRIVLTASVIRPIAMDDRSEYLHCRRSRLGENCELRHTAGDGTRPRRASAGDRARKGLPCIMLVYVASAAVDLAGYRRREPELWT